MNHINNIIVNIRYIVYYIEMPHISNKKLDDKYFHKLYSQLVKVFDTAGTSRTDENLLAEFLTDTEKIMLTKRLAILCMLSEGISKPYISDILFVSLSTVDRISLRYESGGYFYLHNLIKKNSRTIWETLGDLISESVSNQVGNRRKMWMNVLEQKHNKKIFNY